MKKILLGVVATLLLAGSVFATEPEIKIPAELKTKPGRLLRIKAETSSKIVKWYVYSDDADLIPFESTKEAIFSSPIPGKYRILVYTAAGDVPSDPAICIVVVDGAPPVPPEPPEPPTPTDPFVLSLIKAYQVDSTPDKAQKLQSLVKLWKNAASTTVNDPEIATAGKLLQVLHGAAQELIGNDLMTVRDAIRVELDKNLPRKSDTPLDDATRKLIATQFQRVSDALTKVK